MKKLLLPVFLLCLVSAVFAQNSVKKYVLIEHITNSKCSVCGSKNPAFYNLINQAQYASSVHHVSIHPSFPYNTCVFYLANTTENSTRTDYYPNVFSTPTVVLNGVVNPSGNQLLTANKLNSLISQTSPLELKVTESGSGNTRQVTVKAKAYGAIPAANYKIYAAVVEKTVVLPAPAPAGGANHYDVFRKMLPGIDGQTFTAPAAGEVATYTFDYTIPASWNASEVYTVVFVQNTSTKEVLNSGTKFDAGTSAASDIVVEPLQIYPNPGADLVWLDMGGEKAEQVQVFDVHGRLVLNQFEAHGENIQLNLQGLTRGLYLVKATAGTKLFSGKLIVE